MLQFILKAVSLVFIGKVFVSLSKEIEIVYRLSLVRISYCVEHVEWKRSKNRQKYLLITWEVLLTLIVALAVNSIRLERTYILFEFP